ncbi:MAG TPA: branched-chain amino acid ABC transporter permease, partial [Firmicutes bacterium]|nr:branched-chain amino acid ABC transporter permease [Bacillota bacterium]
DVYKRQLIGIVMERLAYKPLRNAPRIAALMTAVGLSNLFQNLMVYFKAVGASPKAFPRVIDISRYEVMQDVYLTSDKILTLVVAVLLMVALQYIVHNTKMGKAMRAVSQDKDAAQLMGINVNTTISFTFALGSALAAAGGILYAVSYGKIIYNMGSMPGLKAFVSAVLGGIGSIPGAVVGGMILGITENAISAAGYSMLRDAVAFAILIIILLIKPAGIFGKNVREKV